MRLKTKGTDRFIIPANAKTRLRFCDAVKTHADMHRLVYRLSYHQGEIARISAKILPVPVITRFNAESLRQDELLCFLVNPHSIARRSMRLGRLQGAIP